ncbi:hypothetical protein GLOTRDRAFT_132151 [Gloeophyllum trabeum ATCC 11539]|uniref:Uncharacterized protein n=1 Tax=Gloeophyllum trabeum (strain ATCC 11539 / FP-39264 / Madison 617) TaxID=670483 RepID=S7RCU9_GLOTA|nr:uncharacterized protein GLOTRDRAFT_132151 [Gloeophyllum trabeum ATCC 11539]EPQ52025.1 hypothetical protein GLOTRDRAFT_132151 [Gloeophyllum trabeum ATCC 11539]
MAFFTPAHATPRPTLPPLRSLDLPYPLAPHASTSTSTSSNDSNDFQSPDLTHPLFHRPRQVSVSSTTSSRLSASPSPPPTSPSALSLSPRPPPQPQPPKFRLVPAPLASADAVLVVPPPSASSQPDQPLLLVGDALRHVRGPGRELAKGARVHPYKIVRERRTQGMVETTK